MTPDAYLATLGLVVSTLTICVTLLGVLLHRAEARIQHLAKAVKAFADITTAEGGQRVTLDPSLMGEVDVVAPEEDTVSKLPEIEPWVLGRR